MVDVVPLLLLVFGLVSLLKPGWVAAVHRRQTAAGTTLDARAVDVTETWLAVTRITGLGFVLFGLYFTLGSL